MSTDDAGTFLRFSGTLSPSSSSKKKTKNYPDENRTSNRPHHPALRHRLRR